MPIIVTHEDQLRAILQVCIITGCGVKLEFYRSTFTCEIHPLPIPEEHMDKPKKSSFPYIKKRYRGWRELCSMHVGRNQKIKEIEKNLINLLAY